MVISPEHASGLDLRRLTVACVAALDREAGSGGLRWIAAIHRNTAHHHVHLVLAGMREDSDGGFVRVDVTKPRLAAMKEALSLEIQRQRTDRKPLVAIQIVPSPISAARNTTSAGGPAVGHSVPVVDLPVVSPLAKCGRRSLAVTSQMGSVIALRAVARRYQRQMERELEEGYRQRQWERAA